MASQCQPTGAYNISLSQLSAALCCVYEKLASFEARITYLEQNGGGGGGGGGGGDGVITQITGPNVSSSDDPRGEIGDWSYNPTLNGGTFFEKISEVPHIWVSWSVANA